jgi:CAAD domains of cyanobacterial aminoacyl-tRNA synthetase
MSTETLQNNENGQAVVEEMPSEMSAYTEPVEIAGDRAIQSTEETWQQVRLNSTIYLEKAKAYAIELYNDNRELLKTLGWLFAGFIGLKLLIAGLDAIDGIPLVSPFLKLIGLIYVGKFVWRYMLLARDRQELMSKIDNTKAEVFGSHN